MFANCCPLNMCFIHYLLKRVETYLLETIFHFFLRRTKLNQEIIDDYIFIRYANIKLETSQSTFLFICLFDFESSLWDGFFFFSFPVSWMINRHKIFLLNYASILPWSNTNIYILHTQTLLTQNKTQPD